MRVQINLSETMVEKVDKLAQMMGVSRSSLCSMFVGQNVITYEKTFEAINLAAKTNLVDDDNGLVGQVNIDELMKEMGSEMKGKRG